MNPDGGLEYRGVRLSDDASLTCRPPAAPTAPLVADNDGVTYSVSPTQIFLVSEGDNVIYQDSWIEFEKPRFSASSTIGASTSAPPPAVRPRR